MDDLGFSGGGSRFNTRFEAGSPIYASQLNALAGGVQVALPMPSLGDAASVSFTPGGSLIAGVQTSGDNTPQGFKVVVGKNEGLWNIQVAKGFCMARVGGSSFYSFTEDGFGQFEIKGFAVFPTAALVAGNSESSPWASQGGYVEIKNAAAGGSDHWGVYLIQNNNSGFSASPWLAVMAMESDAFNKTVPNFGIGQDMQTWFQGWLKRAITIDDFPNPPINFDASSLYPMAIPFPYLKCRRVILANVDWNGENECWDVKQDAIGTITIPQSIVFGGNIEYNPDASDTPPWAGWPLNVPANNDWDGPYDGYQKIQTTDQTEIIG
jgi:hypothetical protein